MYIINNKTIIKSYVLIKQSSFIKGHTVISKHPHQLLFASTTFTIMITKCSYVCDAQSQVGNIHTYCVLQFIVRKLAMHVAIYTYIVKHLAIAKFF